MTTMTIEHDTWKECFCGGVRHGTRLAGDVCDLVAPGWSFGRAALDRNGRLVRIVDLPEWRVPGPEASTLVEPWPVLAPSHSLLLSLLP